MNAQPQTSRATILIVDDDAPIRDVLEMLLGDEGYQIVAAGDGDQGLHLARTTYVDLILIDMWMPGLDGEAFCRAYRAGGGGAPVVLISASRPRNLDETIRACGAVAYLPKPFVIDAVLETVSRHVGVYSA
jgi:CheY-like chemotaxis protein